MGQPMNTEEIEQMIDQSRFTRFEQGIIWFWVFCMATLFFGIATADQCEEVFAEWVCFHYEKLSWVNGSLALVDF